VAPVLVTARPHGHDPLCPVIATHGVPCWYCQEFAKTQAFLDGQLAKSKKIKFNDDQRDLFAREDQPK
jgi:hypothetical protein